MIKAVFLGTPAFALPSMNSLSEVAEIIAVVCQPDRAKDRKGNFIFSPVKKAALEKNIPVYQFEKIRRDGAETLKALAPDIMVTCAYGQILSQEILDIPKYGVINVHGSLLPEYRGSSPLQWSLINGEKSTGVTIMRTDIGLDTGDMLRKVEFDIPDDMYIDELFIKAANEGAKLLKETLPDYIAGKITPEKQDESKATKCVMLKKEDALIDWTQPNYVIRNKIRGMGYGYTFYKGEMLKIFRLSLANDNGRPGEIVVENKTIKVYCGQSALTLEQLQLPNKKKLDCREFLNGTKMISGEVFTID